MSWWAKVQSWCGRWRGRRKAREDARQAAEFESARKAFHQQREWLEARFFDIAAGSGKPRGLRWSEIDFENDVTYARELSTKCLCAFVAITISFEAIEGGLMEGVEAVSRKRAASAMFRHKDGTWTTDGRVLFNLSPTDAVSHFKEELEPVGHEHS
jgi:hypothetical protein